MINKKVPTIEEVKALISASTPNVSIKTLNTNNASSLGTSSNETIGGSGTINLHKISKTGSYNDLLNKPTIPTKLAQLSERAFSNITSRGEAFLEWGGKNFSGSYGAIDACMVPELGANRFAFIPASAWKVEYSRDSGTTWADYGASDGQKLALTSEGVALSIGKADSSHKATSAYMLRITLTTTGVVYTVLNKFLLYVSTNGSSGSYVTIQGRTKANVDANKDTWVGFVSKVPISGWSGWNVINTNGITTHGNQAGHYAQLRFIFGCTGGSTTYTGLQIQKLFAYGGVGWTTPSNMAKNGHMYKYDYNQNVFFPKELYVQSGTSNNYKVLVAGKTNTFTGTSAFNSGKIYLGQGDNNAIDLGSDGRINSGNSTFVGFIGGLFTIGHTSRNTNIRGKATRPTYNNKDLALVSDIPDISGKADKSEIPTNVVKYASNSANVAGTNKTVSKVNPTTLYVENGLIMGGTAAAAGLVTRGICGVTTPDGNGGCQKENLYLNYDGDNNYSRKVVLGAGSSGDAIDGNEKYGNMLSAVRGDQMKAYVSKQIATAIEIAQGKTTTYVIDPTYTTSGNNKEFNISKTNKTDTLLLTGETKIAPNGDTTNLVSIKDKFRVGDIVLTTGKGVKDWFYAGTKVVNGITCYEFRQIDSDTPDLSGYALQSSLSKVATSGSYSDLINKPTIPSMPTNYVTTDTNQTISGTKTFTNAINVKQYNDQNGVSLMNSNNGATQIGSSSRPTYIYGNSKPHWYKNGADQGTLALISDLPTKTSQLTNDSNYVVKSYVEAVVNGWEALKSSVSANTSDISDIKISLDGVGSSIDGLYSYFINGIAKKATADKNGNDITTKYVTVDTEQTISGLKTYSAPKNKSGVEQATVKFKTANGGQIIFGKEGANSGSMIALDQVEGTRRLNFRASATPGAIVWSQPEANSGLYYDVTNVYFRECKAVTFDSASTIRFNKFANATALGTDSSGNLKKTSLSSVATSGSYNDLSNKPTLGDYIAFQEDDQVNYVKLLLKKRTAEEYYGGYVPKALNTTATKKTLVSYNNWMGWETLPTVPTKVSQLTNDSSFATTTQLEKKQNIISGSYAYSLSIVNDKLRVVYKYPSNDKEEISDLTLPSASGGNCSHDSSYYSYGDTGSWRFLQTGTTGNQLDIRYGSGTFSNQEGTVSFTFAKPMSNINYSVVLTLEGSTNIWSYTPIIRSRTKTGFTAYCRLYASDSNTKTIRYIAIRSN